MVLLWRSSHSLSISNAVISSAVKGSLRGDSILLLKAWYIPNRRMRFILSKVVVFINVYLMLMVNAGWLLIILFSTYVMMLGHSWWRRFIFCQPVKLFIQDLHYNGIVIDTVAVS